MAKEELQPYISIDEFLFTAGLGVEQRAGFKALCGRVTMMRPDEWVAKLQEYLDR